MGPGRDPDESSQGRTFLSVEALCIRSRTPGPPSPSFRRTSETISCTPVRAGGPGRYRSLTDRRDGIDSHSSDGSRKVPSTPETQGGP